MSAVWPKYPKCPRIYLPNLCAHAQKFWISLGVCSPCLVLVFQNRKELHCIDEFFSKENNGILLP